MFRRESLHELETKIATIDAEIAAHALASEPVKAAHEVIEANTGQDAEVVSRELAERNLPTLEEIGKIQVRGTVSWWSLHRDRKKLVEKVARLPAE
ncbi:hypothetical protein [Cryobacterium roopkundense]|uniref:Uncharacterized protein n=1 Tax=Cryobacterium roopkundense TaxID=1001240 RepID=A0A7W8ZTH3_9MICO|nr:hypothetical protein [Cryobacterium roopkundense]MBB5639899.1 hypothetical protein [Cryobacterium roopkundense]